MYELQLPFMIVWGFGWLLWALTVYVLVCAWSKWRHDRHP
jgi:hypothetical protein